MKRKNKIKKTFNMIGGLISYRRKEIGITQKELGALIGIKGKPNVQQQYISNIERGLAGIPAEKICALSGALRYAIDGIIEAMTQDEHHYLLVVAASKIPPPKYKGGIK